MKALRKKIAVLFAYRAFDCLYEIGGIKGKDKERLEQNLMRLQEDIYFLDEYLETHWNLNSVKLKSYWNQIHQSLSTLGVPAKSYDDYSAHIYKYQQHEEQLRTNKDLLRLSMEYFYFYKSCDVKLIRRIIYDKAPKINRYFKLSDWRYFDLVTEVNDDVDDLIEDMSTINGNRLQLLINQKGMDAAKSEFTEFLDQIEMQSTARLNLRRRGHYAEIHSKTIAQIVATKILLTKRLSEYKTLDNTDKKVG